MKNVKPTQKPKQAPAPMPKSSLLTERAKKIMLAAIVFLLYAMSIGFDFTQDDTLMITSNEYTKQGLEGVGDIFTHDAFDGFFGEGGGNLVAGGRYRPMTHFIFAVEYHFFGPSPAIGHFVNLLSYLLLVLILYAVLKKLLRDLPDKNVLFAQIPFLATLIFAVHPLHTEVVASIKGLDEIFCLGGALATLYFILLFIDKSKPVFLLAAMLSYALAIFSKESAITWLAVIPLALYFFRNVKPMAYVQVLLPLLLVSAVFILIRMQIVGSFLNMKIDKELLNNPFVDSTKSQEIATVIFTWLLYIKLLFFPHPLTHDYYPKQIPILDFSSFSVLVALAVVLLTIFLAIKGLKKKNIWAFGIAFFWITFSITSNLLFNIGTFMNERFMFTPLIGFAIIIAWLYYKYADVKSYSRWLPYLAVVILLLASIKTITRSMVWKDNFTLFTTDVKTSSNSAKVNVSAAEVLLIAAETERNPVKQAQMINDAIAYLQKAAVIHPSYFGAYDLAGKAYYMKKNYHMSLQEYMHCYKLDPADPAVLQNIYAVAIGAVKDSAFTVARSAFIFINRLHPDSLNYRFQMADLYKTIEQYDSSMTMFRSITLQWPSYTPAYNKMAEIQGSLQRLDSAEYFIRKALEINPNDYTSLENMGIVYGLRGDFSNALQYFFKAEKIDSSNYKLYNNIGNTYKYMRDAENAQKYFSIANRKYQSTLKTP